MSVSVQNTSFCQSADGDIKSYLVTALALVKPRIYMNFSTFTDCDMTEIMFEMDKARLGGTVVSMSDS